MDKNSMTARTSTALDVAVIGGGPAGISACLELSRAPGLKIDLFESEAELGGIPRSCHVFFGLRDLKRIYTGPGYARKLVSLIRKTRVGIHTATTVTRILPGAPGELHRFTTLSAQGFRTYESRFVVLATGCYEIPQAARRIPGGRPAGVITSGALQELVNLDHLYPGKGAVIIGSEYVALSSLLTLRRAGVSVVGIVEADPDMHADPFLAKALGLFHRCPIFTGTSVQAILGNRRVEGVQLGRSDGEKSFQVQCDTVILCGRFRPYAPLIDHTPIEQDTRSLGPSVDEHLMTTVPGLFAAGNVLRGGDMHDLCSLEGRYAAQGILDRLSAREPEESPSVGLRAEHPVRYIVPQRITASRMERLQSDRSFPGFSVQLAHTVRDAVLEAWSGTDRIWQKSFRKLLGNHRVRLPLKEMDWSGVDSGKGITIRLGAL